MKWFKGFAALALAGLIFTGMPTGAASEEGPLPGQTDEDPPFVEGRIEEAGINGILVNGRYYFIEDYTVIEDGRMNRLGKDALVEGSKVSLFLEGTKVIQIIVIGGAAE